MYYTIFNFSDNMLFDTFVRRWRFKDYPAHYNDNVNPALGKCIVFAVAEISAS